MVSTLYALITSRTHCSCLIFTDFLTWNVRTQAQKTINKAYHTNTRGNYQQICVESKPGKVKGNLHKFFIMSTEFDKNISDRRYDCTDHKNAFDFFMRLVKRPKIAVKKSQNLIFKVNFQRQKSSESL